MRSLFDVSFLIAMFDPEHVFHEPAQKWWEMNRVDGWASCPITENGVCRILASHRYRGMPATTVDYVIDRIKRFREGSDHAFWPDNLSLLDESVFDFSGMYSSRHLTDVYLLALAVENAGRLVTFDGRIKRASVRTARAEHLRVVETHSIREL